ncbi:MAG: nuclear transport factor 2 family protein [Nitrososphaeraceae archaeon]
MPITVEFVDNLFKNLSNGNGDAFFTSVADDVNWTVMGTHPLAGVYNSKADFLKSTFERLSRILKGGVILKVTHIFVSGDIAVVEMTSTSTTLNGKPWPNTYCWILRFVDGIVKEVRAYVDSYLVQQVIEENE